MNWETIATYLWTFGAPVLLILAVVLYVFRPGSKRRYQRDAQIPFEDEAKARASRKQTQHGQGQGERKNRS